MADIEYDYIVVGGGTAGLVVANRLTEDPSVHVLVIEAGGDKNSDPKITIPALGTTVYGNPEYDWCFKSVPQKHLNGKVLDLSRGKLLGGSSAINILAVIYPHRGTFDAWEQDLGNKGWGWEGISKYFNKAITTQDPSTESAKSLGLEPIDRSLHGTKGLVQSSYASFFGEPAKAWLPTFRNLGLDAKKDSLTGEALGAYTSVSTIDRSKGERSHPGVAYHQPAKSRPNYHVVTEALVEKIVLEKQTNGDVVATGVQYVRDGKISIASAKREVILSAGVFGSPQLLELSGIGNPEVLSASGIETIVESRGVGENLQDHALSGLCFEVKDGIPTTDMIRDPEVMKKALEMYQKDKSGLLSSPFGGCAAFLPVIDWTTDAGRIELAKLADEQLSYVVDSNIPSLKLQYAALRRSLENPYQGNTMAGLGMIQMHFEQASRQGVFALTRPENFIVILAGLMTPFSRGTTHIVSASPREQPRIDPAYHSHPLDVEVHGRQVRFVEKIASTEPLASVIKEGGARLPEGADLSTVEKAKEHIRGHSISFNHGSSTCSMMPKELGGVVDTSLRVYGVKSLRIVDASIMPIIPEGNIQSVVYALAEKAADIIKTGQIE